MSGLARAVGRLEARVASLERDNAMIKRLAGRALLLGLIWLASIALLFTADKGSDLVAALLKALITS